MESLKGATPYAPEEIAAAATSFYGKLTAADKYKPSGKFNGSVTLVKAIDNYVQMGEDYGLSEVKYIHIYILFIFIIFLQIFFYYFTNLI